MDSWAWELWHGENFLGTLQLEKRDFPWFNCHFAAAPEFDASYRALFDREYQLLRERNANPEIDWTDFYEEHIESLHLQYRPMTSDAPRFEVRLIHIQADKAWFRPIFPDADDQE